MRAPHATDHPAISSDQIQRRILPSLIFVIGNGRGSITNERYGFGGASITTLKRAPEAPIWEGARRPGIAREPNVTTTRLKSDSRFLVLYPVTRAFNRRSRREAQSFLAGRKRRRRPAATLR